MNKNILKTLVIALAIMAIAIPSFAAVSTSTIHSKAIPGEVGLVKESIYSQSSAPLYPVGTKFTMADGREFRYAHFGAAVTQGKLVSQDITESSVVDTDNSILAPASCVTTTDGTVGSYFVEITKASVTVNQFAGAFLAITDDTGEGYMYKIKSNTASNDPASGTFRIQLEDPLIVALDASSDYEILGNPYANVEGAVGSDGADYSVPVGVTVRSMTIAYYGWIQTKGTALVLQDGTVNIGDTVTMSDGVAGAVQTMDAYTEPIVGYCTHSGDSTGYTIIELNLM